MTRKEEREHAAREYTKKWYKDLGIEPEDYPTDAKITIDEFTKGAKWADRTMLDKVCEWLRCNLPYSSKPPYQLIEDLRKAMEE